MIYFVIPSVVSSLFLPVFHHMHGVRYVENNLRVKYFYWSACCVRAMD
jgi:hypothetical protein